MSIPNPPLDDITFQQLVDQAKKNIPNFSKNWTNLNPSDPGMTFIELFAYIIETQIFSMNRITLKNYLKFLKLLGIELSPPIAPKLDVTFVNDSNDSNNGGSYLVKKGTRLLVKNTKMPIEVAKDIFFIPSLRAENIITYSDFEYTKYSISNAKEKIDAFQPAEISNSISSSVSASLKNLTSNQPSTKIIPLFGKEPKEESMFYIFFKFSNKEITKGDVITVNFYLYEQDLPQVGIHGNEALEEFAPQNKQIKKKIVWEFPMQAGNGNDNVINLKNPKTDKLRDPRDATPENKWKNSQGSEQLRRNTANDIAQILWSEADVIEDTTDSLNKSGRLSIRFPYDIEEFDNEIFNQNIPVFVLNSNHNNHINDGINRNRNNIDGDDKYKEDGNSSNTDHTDDKLINSNTNTNEKRNLHDNTFILRCRILEKNVFSIPPRLENLFPNTTSCIVGQTIQSDLVNKTIHTMIFETIKEAKKEQQSTNDATEMRTQSTGLANQIFEVENKENLPIIHINSLKVGENDLWQEVRDFDSSGPLDKHYMVLDNNKGFIQFGDGENGKIPPKNNNIKINYCFGITNDMVLPPGQVFENNKDNLTIEQSNLAIKKKGLKALVGVNTYSSSTGRKQETLREAIIRARQQLAVPFKAVSIKDYEYIAKNTPGLRIGKVKAFASNLDEEENTILIAAIPYSFSERSYADKNFKDTILRHLEKHKLITTRIRMVDTKFLDISLKMKLKTIANGIESSEGIKYMTVTKLKKFFQPYPIIFHADMTNSINPNWDFGNNIYKSELIALIKSIKGIEDVIDFDLSILKNKDNSNAIKDNQGNIIVNDLSLVYLQEVKISFLN